MALEAGPDAELELLRLENDTLRRKLAGLEESLSTVEQRYTASLQSNFEAMDERLKAEDAAARPPRASPLAERRFRTATTKVRLCARACAACRMSIMF